MVADRWDTPVCGGEARIISLLSAWELPCIETNIGLMRCVRIPALPCSLFRLPHQCPIPKSPQLGNRDIVRTSSPRFPSCGDSPSRKPSCGDSRGRKPGTEAPNRRNSESAPSGGRPCPGTRVAVIRRPGNRVAVILGAANREPRRQIAATRNQRHRAGGRVAETELRRFAVPKPELRGSRRRGMRITMARWSETRVGDILRGPFSDVRGSPLQLLLRFPLHNAHMLGHGKPQQQRGKELQWERRDSGL